MNLAEQIELMEILLKANPDARVKDLWFIMTNGKPQYYTRESSMNEMPVEKERSGRPETPGRYKAKYLKTYKLPT